MRIAYIITNIKSGGPYRVVESLMKYELGRKNDVFLISVFGKDDDKIIRELNSNITVLNLGLGNKLQFITGGKRSLNRILHQYHIDIAHSHGILPDFLVSSNKQSIKITTIHNNMDEDYTLHFGRVLGKIYANWHKNILKKFDKKVCCAKSVYEAMNKRTSTKNMVYIRNGIIEPRITKEKANSLRQTVRQDLYIPKDAKVFIFAGSLMRRKRVPELTKAFAAAKLDNSFLLIVGDGEEKAQCAVSDNIKFLGRVDDVWPYLVASDIYVSNSESEGFSMAILEALSVNKTLLLSNIPSHQEIIELCPQIYKGSLFKDYNDLIQNFQKVRLSKNYPLDLLYAISEDRMGKEYDRIYIESIATRK